MSGNWTKLLTQPGGKMKVGWRLMALFVRVYEVQWRDLTRRCHDGVVCESTRMVVILTVINWPLIHKKGSFVCGDTARAACWFFPLLYPSSRSIYSNNSNYAYFQYLPSGQIASPAFRDTFSAVPVFGDGYLLINNIYLRWVWGVYPAKNFSSYIILTTTKILNTEKISWCP